MKWQDVLIFLLVLALLVTGAFSIKCLVEESFSWGIRSFGDYAHLDYKMLCFYTDPQTVEAGGHSHCNISGFLDADERSQG